MSAFSMETDILTKANVDDLFEESKLPDLSQLPDSDGDDDDSDLDERCRISR